MIFLRALTALMFIFALGISPLAYSQDEDADLDLESSDTGGNFDDLESELNNETPPAAAAPAAPAAPAEPAPAEPAAPVAEEPPPPAVEEEKQAEEQVPPTVEEAPAEEVAEPAPGDPPPEEAPAEEQAAEPEATPPPATEEESPVFKSEVDTPDEEFEARLSRIYKQFYGTRTSDAEWVQIVGPKASERYVVQGGDTLWGISQTFFGNGFFWPKLWQLNAEYTNPHLLEISDSIQFSPGTVASEPPSINLTQKASKYNEPDPPKASVTPEQAKAYMANVQMPPPLPYRPVINKIPNSLPVFENVSSGYDDSGFSLESVRRFQISDITHLGFSVADGYPSNDGEVIEIETGGNQLNIYQEGVAKLSGAKEGDRFYAFRVHDKINNSHGSGYPIEYQGEVEVLESVGNGRYRILCLEAISQVMVGALLRKGNMPKVDYSKNGTPANVSAKVFGGHYDSDRQSLSAGNLVYIAGGKNKGIEVNQLLTVLKDFKIRNPSTVLQEPQEPIGLIKILNVNNNVSTGLVLESREDVRQGDVTGPGDVY